MPRPTKQVKELRDALEVCRAHLKQQCSITDGLRRDLEGTHNANKVLHETVTLLNSGISEVRRELTAERNKYHELNRKHQKVCVMWAEIMSQFKSAELIND